MPPLLLHVTAVVAAAAFAPERAAHAPGVRRASASFSPPRRLRAAPVLCDVPMDVDDGPSTSGDGSGAPDRMAMGWQEEVERLLSLSTKQADREVILKDLLGRSDEIADDVREAVNSGNLSSLVPSDGEGARVLEEMAAVQRQLLDDLLPQAASEAQTLLTDPSRLANEVQRAAAEAPALAEEAPATLTALGSLLQDPARAAALVQQEARNAVSRTPEGLEMPRYTVLATGSGYEVREYEPASVAAIAEPGSGFGGALGAGALAAYNRLASYFLGANAMRETLELTSPVRVDASPGGGGCMSLPLPSRFSASTAPAASSSAVQLKQLGRQTLGVARFSGLATDGEVRRNLARLRRDLELGGVTVVAETAADGELSYALMQYNPPYTLPWLRTNEIALPVQLQPAAEAPTASESAQPAASGDAVEAAVPDDEWSDDAPSDMD